MNYRDLFGEILADHHESPRHFGPLDAPSFSEKGFNPVCGDQVQIAGKIEGDRLSQCQFTGEGCSICMASASILMEMVEGKPLTEVKNLIEGFREKMQGQDGGSSHVLPAEDSEADVVALYGVKRFPVRIKCALLSWTTLKKGLENASHNTKS